MSALGDLIGAGGDRVVEHAPVGSRTTYRVGGSARVLVTLASEADLDELGPLVRATGLAVVPLGNGSNLLVADGEHEVLVMVLAGEFATVSWHDDGDAVAVEAGGGMDMPVAARQLARDGVVGLEWAVGVPGTFGGGVAMNAGGHGSDLAASLTRAKVWRDDEVTWWGSDRLDLGYRSSALEPGDVVLGATLRLLRGDREEAEGRLREVVRWRREHQPGGPNAGSVFRNPPGDHAARLIEAAGCKGLRHFSAQVSEKHANFIQADAGGSAQDVYELMGIVRQRVRDYCGVTLLLENRLLGFAETP